MVVKRTHRGKKACKTPDDVLLVSFHDRRERYKFVQQALEAVGIAVDVKLRGALSKTCYSPAKHRREGRVNYRCAIFIGGGPFVLCHYLFIKLRYRMPVYLRMGADADQGLKSRAYYLWSHGKLLRYLAITVQRLSIKWLIKWCDGCFTVSDDLSQVMVRRYSARSAITLPRAMTLSEPCTRNFSDMSQIRLLSITNLAYREKFLGICKLMDLFRNAGLGGERVEWRIVGGGAYEHNLRAAVNAFHNVDVGICYLGFCGNVEEQYQWADVFIYASELDWAPNVLLEAKSFGLPVLMHEYEPLRNMFPNGGALFFDTNSGEKFYSSLHRMFDPAERGRLADINRRDIEAEYSPVAIGNRFKQAMGWDA